MIMRKINLRLIGLLMVMALVTGGCNATRERLLDSDQSQVKLRQMQSRRFDTTDRRKTLRTAISTLQDLGFVIDKADLDLGIVSATKLDGYAIHMTVSVRPYGKKSLTVRANGQYEAKPITEPRPYQNFFAALEKSMFLTAHQVD